MTGGVARNIGVVRALEEVIGMPVIVSPHAQLAGAIGAAALAAQE
jgi:activator of 2-hydroxyglutaryl-CoA dehydratase